MDQLKLVLEHKFWILTAVAVLLPPIGWWMASGDLAAQTSQRTKTIEGALSTITNAAKDPSKAPNASWTQSALEIDTKLSDQLSQSQVRLFDREKSLQTWPEMVDKALKESKAGYRGENNSKAFNDAKQFFVARYNDDWLRVLDILEPYIPETSAGKVMIDYKKVSRAPVDTWTDMLFTGPQMWDVQEDLWFLKALALAIAKVNQGATDIGEAPIKKLAEMTLRGGDQADLELRRTSKASRGNFDADDVFGSDGSTPGVAPGGGGGLKKDKGDKQQLMRYVGSQGKWQSRGFVLKLVMEEKQIPRLISVLSESKFPVAIKHLEFKAYDFHPGAEASQIKWTTLQGGGGPAGDQSQYTERQKLHTKIVTALDVAFNQNNLSDVILAGTFTIFNPPPKSSTSADAGASPGKSPNQPVASQPAKSGTAAKALTPGAKSGAAGSAKGPAAPDATKSGPSPSKVATPAAAGKSSPGVQEAPAKSSGAPAKAAAAVKSPSAVPATSAPGAQGTKGAAPAGK